MKKDTFFVQKGLTSESYLVIIYTMNDSPTTK